VGALAQRCVGQWLLTRGTIVFYQKILEKIVVVEGKEKNYYFFLFVVVAILSA